MQSRVKGRDTRRGEPRRTGRRNRHHGGGGDGGESLQELLFGCGVVVDAELPVGIGVMAHTHLAGAIGEVAKAVLFVEPYIAPPGKAPGARPVGGCFGTVVVEVPIGQGNLFELLNGSHCFEIFRKSVNNFGCYNAGMGA